jgi:hypothetical protein
MFKGLLNAVVLVPTLLGLLVAAARGRRGAPLLLALVFTYDVLFVLMLFYLRRRWV